MRSLSFHDKASFQNVLIPKRTSAKENAVYTIYSYCLSDENTHQKREIWKRHESVESREDALKLARGLLKSELFNRIDIKKKFFDPKLGRMIEITEKSYDMFGEKSYHTHIVCAGLALAALTIVLLNLG